MSLLMAFVASRSRRLVAVRTLFGPMLHLSTDQAFVSCLVLQGLGICHRASLEGGQHLALAYLFPLLSFLGIGLPLLFYVIKVLVAIWTISYKKAAASCCCSCFDIILMHTGTGICSLKSPVPHRSPSPDWETFGGPILAFPERQWGSLWAPVLFLRSRHS